MIRLRSMILSGLVVGLAACGQKGDLYMPQEREAVATVPASAATAPAAQDDEEAQRVQPPPAGNATGTPPPPANNN